MEEKVSQENQTGVIRNLIRNLSSGFQKFMIQNKQTEPAADNLGRGTVTGSAEAHSSEHTHPNSNTSHTIGQSILDWQSFSLEEAYEDKEPIQFIVDKIFQLPSLNIVYGSPGSFKSFLLADLACCVAGGKEWLPPFGNPSGTGKEVIQGAAVWIDFDNGQRRTLDRFKALGTAIGLTEDAPLKIFTMPNPVFDAREPIQVIELQILLESQKAKLVVLDNLAMISGDADENSADMAAIFNNLRRVSEITETAVVVIHHPRKGAPETHRMGESLRGHSSIEAAIDLALYIKRSGNELTVNIKPTKVRDSIVETFSVRFEFDQDQNGQLENARFYSCDGVINNQQVMVMDAIWNALGDGEVNKGELTTKVAKLLDENNANGIGENSIRDIIKVMHDQGFLKLTKGKNNAQIFSRNSDKPYKKFSEEEGGTP